MKMLLRGRAAGPGRYEADIRYRYEAAHDMGGLSGLWLFASTPASCEEAPRPQAGAADSREV